MSQTVRKCVVNAICTDTDTYWLYGILIIYIIRSSICSYNMLLLLIILYGRKNTLVFVKSNNLFGQVTLVLGLWDFFRCNLPPANQRTLDRWMVHTVSFSINTGCYFSNSAIGALMRSKTWKTVWKRATFVYIYIMWPALVSINPLEASSLSVMELPQLQGLFFQDKQMQSELFSVLTIAPFLTQW